MAEADTSEVAAGAVSETTQPAASSLDNRLLWILRISAALCLAGWAWQHLYWQGPYSRLLWSPAVFDLAERFGLNWDDLAGNGESTGLIRHFGYVIGWLYAISAIFALTVRRQSYLQITALLLSSVMLCVLAYCNYLNSLRQVAMWIEHGGQFLTPALLVAALLYGVRSRVTVAIALVAVCMTFGGHGAYAAGLSPTPGYFYGMTIVILHVSEQTATTILRTAGILDFIICAAIFIPYLRRPALLYATTWGLLTSLARPVSGMSLTYRGWGADLFLHEAVLRAPHALIPLFLLLVYSRISPPQDRCVAIVSNQGQAEA